MSLSFCLFPLVPPLNQRFPALLALAILSVWPRLRVVDRRLELRATLGETQMSATEPVRHSVLLERFTNSVQAFSLVHFLSAQGLPVTLRDRPLRLALGEIPFLEAASELYLDDPERLDEARTLIERFRSGYLGVRGTAWTCPSCGEQHEPQFAACWRCGASRDG